MRHALPHMIGRNVRTKASVAELLRRLPGKVSEKWPEGERFVTALAHGSMSVELYAPAGVDPQSPHAQDELYFIHSGTGELVIDDPPRVRAGGCVLRSGRRAAPVREVFR